MVIRMRHTRAHTRNRRSHHALQAATLATCEHCGKARRPHHMCLNCGYYNGKQVMDLEAERAKREARIKAKQERIRAESGPGATAPADSKIEEVQDEKETPESKEAKLKEPSDAKEESATRTRKGKRGA